MSKAKKDKAEWNWKKSKDLHYLEILERRIDRLERYFDKIQGRYSIENEPPIRVEENEK